MLQIHFPNIFNYINEWRYYWWKTSLNSDSTLFTLTLVISIFLSDIISHWSLSIFWWVLLYVYLIGLIGRQDNIATPTIHNEKKKKNGESLNINRVEIRVWSREPIKKGAHSHSHFYRKIKIRVLNQLIQLNHDKKRLLEAQYTPSNVLHISEPNH